PAVFMNHQRMRASVALEVVAVNDRQNSFGLNGRTGTWRSMRSDLGNPAHVAGKIPHLMGGCANGRAEGDAGNQQKVSDGGKRKMPRGCCLRRIFHVVLPSVCRVRTGSGTEGPPQIAVALVAGGSRSFLLARNAPGESACSAPVGAP